MERVFFLCLLSASNALTYGEHCTAAPNNLSGRDGRVEGRADLRCRRQRGRVTWPDSPAAGRPNAHRNRDFLPGPAAVPPGPAIAAASGLVPARRPECALLPR